MPKKKVEALIVRYGQLIIFEISEEELGKLESGYTNSLLPSVTAFFISSSLTLFLSLLNMSDNNTKLYYLLSLYISIALSLIFLVFTCINYSKSKKCISNIRNRKQPKGTSIN